MPKTVIYSYSILICLCSHVAKHWLRRISNFRVLYVMQIFYIWKYISEYLSQSVTSEYNSGFIFSLFFFLCFWNFQISRSLSFVNLHWDIIYQNYMVRQLGIWIFIASCWGSSTIIATRFVYKGVWLINLVIWLCLNVKCQVLSTDIQQNLATLCVKRCFSIGTKKSLFMRILAFFLNFVKVFDLIWHFC